MGLGVTDTLVIISGRIDRLRYDQIPWPYACKHRMPRRESVIVGFILDRVGRGGCDSGDNYITSLAASCLIADTSRGFGTQGRRIEIPRPTGRVPVAATFARPRTFCSTSPLIATSFTTSSSGNLRPVEVQARLQPHRSRTVHRFQGLHRLQLPLECSRYIHDLRLGHKRCGAFRVASTRIQRLRIVIQLRCEVRLQSSSGKGREIIFQRCRAPRIFGCAAGVIAVEHAIVLRIGIRYEHHRGPVVADVNHKPVAQRGERHVRQVPHPGNPSTPLLSRRESAPPVRFRFACAVRLSSVERSLRPYRRSLLGSDRLLRLDPPCPRSYRPRQADNFPYRRTRSAQPASLSRAAKEQHRKAMRIASFIVSGYSSASNLSDPADDRTHP